MNTPLSSDPVPPRSARLVELLLLFLRLGVTGFGGPAAHMALMEREVVTQRGWLTSDELLDLISAANLIPGPNSTEVAMHIGYRRAGFPGLFVAGTAFILPAALIVALCARAYVQLGTLPAVGPVLLAIKPVLIAIVCQALWPFARTAIRTPLHGAIAGASLVACACGLHELWLLAGAGGFSLLTSTARPANRLACAAPAALLVPALPATAAAATVSSLAMPLSVQALGLYFLKIGSVLFGSGYVLVAFLRTDLVTRWHWLTQAQLLDAVAVGQITPGPVFTTATFIGYVLLGPLGALVATLGIFLPAFAFVALTAPILHHLHRSRPLRAVLDGVNLASLALLFVAAAGLGVAALPGLGPLCIALVSTLCLLFDRSSPTRLLLAAALLGAVFPAVVT